MKLTKEQYESLVPWEKEIRSAYKNSYVHISGADFRKVAQIYSDVFGKPLTQAQMGCNTCRLNSMRKLGELYEQYQAELEDTEEKKTKKGRPKKLTEKDA